MASEPNETQDPTASPPGGSTATKPRPARPRRKPLPVWQVVLLDDEDHTYAYVIEMLGRVFGHPPHRAMRLAEEVDHAGRAVVFRSHRELVELKSEQIAAYGADARVETCLGSMTAVVEPA